MRRFPEDVALLAEAWIEILIAVRSKARWCVALLAEAWIEIGLLRGNHYRLSVALLAEAWIEMCRYCCLWSLRPSPSSRSVDRNK